MKKKILMLLIGSVAAAGAAVYCIVKKGFSSATVSEDDVYNGELCSREAYDEYIKDETAVEEAISAPEDKILLSEDDIEDMIKSSEYVDGFLKRIHPITKRYCNSNISRYRAFYSDPYYKLLCDMEEWNDMTTHLKVLLLQDADSNAAKKRLKNNRELYEKLSEDREKFMTAYNNGQFDHFFHVLNSDGSTLNWDKLLLCILVMHENYHGYLSKNELLKKFEQMPLLSKQKVRDEATGCYPVFCTCLNRAILVLEDVIYNGEVAGRGGLTNSHYHIFNHDHVNEILCGLSKQ